MKGNKLTGKVIEDFNDGKDNMKFYKAGDIYTAEKSRYEELQGKGYLEEGKELKEVKDYLQMKKNEEKKEED